MGPSLTLLIPLYPNVEQTAVPTSLINATLMAHTHHTLFAHPTGSRNGSASSLVRSPRCRWPHRETRGRCGADRQARDLPYVAALVRDAPTGKRLRYPHC